MPTGDEFVRLAMKRFLSENRIDDNFLEYLQEMFFEGISRIFPSQGIFHSPHTLTNNGDGTFTVGPNTLYATDGEGHILKLTGTSRRQNVPFEDTASFYYWIALHYIEIPIGVYSNPRTGYPEYDKTSEEIGVLGTPDLVTDAGGGTIRLDVDSIFQSSVDHSGSIVRVWLVNPMSTDEDIAIEELTVQYDGTNYVTTVSNFGQGALSTIAGNYQVAAIGTTIRRDATTVNPFAADYVVIGYVEGDTTSSSIDDAVDLSGGWLSLQRAYDGMAGSGAGRTIVAADQAVLIRQESASAYDKDIANAALRINKDVPSTLPDTRYQGEMALDIKYALTEAGAVVCRMPLVDYSGNDFVRVEEVVDVVSGNPVYFQRAGVDIEFTGIETKIIPSYDLLEISGSSLGNDGVYRIFTVTNGTTLAVNNIDGSAMTFTAESGITARIYRPVLSFGVKEKAIEIVSIHDMLEDLNTGDYQTALSILLPESVSNPTEPVIDVQKTNIGRRLRLLDNGKLEVVTLDTDGDVGVGGSLQTTDEIISGDFVTATTDITATSGSIVAGQNVTATAGEVRAGTNIKADNDANGSGEFVYGQAKSQIIRYTADDVKHQSGDLDFSPGSNVNYSSITSAIGATVLYGVIPVHLPIGASVTTIRHKVRDQEPSELIEIWFTERQVNMDVSATGPGNRNSLTLAASLSSTGYETITHAGGPFVIQAGYIYEFVIKFSAADINVDYYSTELEYDITTLKAGMV